MKFLIFLLLLFSHLSFAEPREIQLTHKIIDTLVGNLKKELEVNPNQNLQLNFTHLSQRTFINSDLESKLLYLEAKLRESNISHKVDIDFSIIDEKDFDYLRDGIVGEINQPSVDKYLVEYETQTQKVLPVSIRQEIIKHFKIDAIKNRIKKVRNQIFGTPLGITIFDYFKVDKSLSESDKALKARKSNLLALKTAMLAMTSFSLSVVENTYQVFGKEISLGFMDFLGSTHLTSSAVLGAWVYVAIRNVENITSVKRQGRSLIAKFHDNKLKLKFKTNKILYNSFSILQELVANTLITTGIIGLSGVMDFTLESWLTVIVSNAVLSAFSYAPAEVYASKLFARSGELLKKADSLRTSGIADEKNKYLLEAKRIDKKAGRVLDVWWNVIFPICKWGGFTAAMAASSDLAGETNKLANWMMANSGLLFFAGFGLAQDTYDNLNKIKDKSRKALQYLRIIKPDKSRYCPTFLEVNSL